MHGLVSQTAGPSPQIEYLGITYFEDSNADRSSALGLRLNQQNKMKTKQNKKNKDIPCEIKMSHVQFAKCSVNETSDFMYFHSLNTGSLVSAHQAFVAESPVDHSESGRGDCSG